MRHSLPRRTRCWSRPRRRWRTWASMSTAAAGPGGGSMSRPGNTCCSPTGGTPASLTCPGGRAYWGRWKAAPPMTPRTGWHRPPPPGGPPSVAAIDMCSIYASAVRRMLPGAQLAVDLFHVVHLAVKMTGDVRRRVVRGKYGRRGRSGDPEYGIKNLLVRNLEHLSPAQFAKVTGILGSDPAGQEIAAAWIAKEKLRHVLSLRARVTGSVPCERNVRDRLFAFYDWCAQNDDIPEPVSLARTVSRWEDEIVCAVLAGVTNDLASHCTSCC